MRKLFLYLKYPFRKKEREKEKKPKFDPITGEQYVDVEEIKVWEKEREKEKLIGIHEREEAEYRKVEKKIKEKDADWLGKWLQKFSVEGDFFLKEKREKIKKDDFL